MRRVGCKAILCFLILFTLTVAVVATDSPYNHDRFGTIVTGSAGEKNHVRRFSAYISVFDGADDDDGDGTPDYLGIPHFVAYEIRSYEGELPKAPERPGEWTTDEKLYKLGLAPKDSTYRYSKGFRQNNSNWYERGHLCMKHHAWRLGEEADRSTHTVLNAVPQRKKFNKNIWQDLEKLTSKWADKYGSIWVVTGPVFEPQANKPNAWLGEAWKGEMLVAIPDALFKIVIRTNEQNQEQPHVLAFMYPQDVESISPYDHSHYMKSVDIIEQKTGLDFLTVLSDDIEKKIEQQKAENLWPLD